MGVRQLVACLTRHVMMMGGGASLQCLHRHDSLALSHVCHLSSFCTVDGFLRLESLALLEVSLP